MSYKPHEDRVVILMESIESRLNRYPKKTYKVKDLSRILKVPLWQVRESLEILVFIKRIGTFRQRKALPSLFFSNKMPDELKPVLLDQEGEIECLRNPEEKILKLECCRNHYSPLCRQCRQYIAHVYVESHSKLFVNFIRSTKNGTHRT